MRFYIYYGGDVSTSIMAESGGFPVLLVPASAGTGSNPLLRVRPVFIMAESGGFEPPIQILTV